MITPPPLNIKKPKAFYDTECFPNYWLLKFKTDNGSIYSFKLNAGQSFSLTEINRIKLIFEAYITISFNGNGYDIPMITAALIGYNTDQLKWLNDRIIVEQIKPWDLGLPKWQPADHIDVMEVAPGAGSQKLYAGRIHCKTMRDLPYDPNQILSELEIKNVDEYCENDLSVLESLYKALTPHIEQRELLSKKYQIDLRSKSDAQVAEAVLKRRCEQALGYKIYKPNIDWNMTFNYKIPPYISYSLPQLQKALDLVKMATFRLGANGTVEMPYQLNDLEITINQSTYKLGIGGLHSQEKKSIHISDDNYIIRDNDVASYYPSLILNSGEWPQALGETFLQEYAAIKSERLAAKALQAKLKKSGDTKSHEYIEARIGNEGGKIMINGTFGKTGSPYSILFAPTMLIQTTITGQLSLLMLIEWHEINNIQVISANTDGMLIKCPRDKVYVSEQLIKEWQNRTGLEMETAEYKAIYSRDVNNYYAIKTDGEIKRKGEYSKSGLDEKKNPDVEICSDAVAEFLANGIPIEYTLAMCRDIRKFIVIRKVASGGVKMWGEGPRKGARVMDMVATLLATGWIKEGRKWRRGNDELLSNTSSAYNACFTPQASEYLGKVVRWYYSTQAPGPIVYASNGNTVSLSYGARPCMTLPDEFPNDVDYNWYLAKCENILKDIGYYVLT